MMTAKRNHSFATLKTLLLGIVDVDAAVDCDIHSLQLDSRLVAPGSLFFACEGTQVHGIKFASQAAKNGAAAILWEADDLSASSDNSDGWGIPVIKVKHLSRYVGVIAERFYAYPSRELLTIGVTGTNGKTSCCHFLAHCLTTDNNKCGLIGTLGNGVYGGLQTSTHTTPDAITLHSLFDEVRSQGAKHLVMEVSSHGLSQNRVAGVEFDVAIFTNLSRDHLDYHADMDEYFSAKTRLFEFATLKYAIVNTDDEFGRKLVSNNAGPGKQICYGFGDIPEQCDSYVIGKELDFSTTGTKFKVETSWGSANVQTSLLGEFNVSNLLAVLGALLALELPLSKAKKQIESCETIPGRMEKVCGNSDLPLVVIDYAHTPDALEKALNALAAHKSKQKDNNSKLWCVFGCGGDRDIGKRPEMGRVAEKYADNVIVTNDNPRTEDAQQIIAEIVRGIKNTKSITVDPDRVKAIGEVIDMAAADDIILIAGKGHEEYQVIGNVKQPYPGDRCVVERKMQALQKMRQGQ